MTRVLTVLVALLLVALAVVGVWGYYRGLRTQAAGERHEAAQVEALQAEGITVGEQVSQADLQRLAADMSQTVQQQLAQISARLDARIVGAMKSEGRATLVADEAPPAASQACPPPQLDLGVQVAAVATEGDRTLVTGEQWATDEETGRRWTRALEADVTKLWTAKPRRRPERWFVGGGLGVVGDGVSQIRPTLEGVLVGPPIDPRWRVRVRPWGGVSYGVGRLRVGEDDVRPWAVRGGIGVAW